MYRDELETIIQGYEGSISFCCYSWFVGGFIVIVSLFLYHTFVSFSFI